VKLHSGRLKCCLLLKLKREDVFSGRNGGPGEVRRETEYFPGSLPVFFVFLLNVRRMISFYGRRTSIS